MSADLLSLFTATFVTFFVLIDALGVAPVFATLTAGAATPPIGEGWR